MMMPLLLLAAAATSLLGLSQAKAPPCAPGSPQALLPFCNTTLGFAERARDLVSRLQNTDEKIALLATTSDGVPSLGIAPFQWWSEGLHGVRCGHGITCASGVTTTIFPQPIATAAAFNETLWYAVGSAISDEFRAFANSGRGNLSVFAPNINIFRDQRWGRGQETPGEDPYLASRYAVQYVSGMQGSLALGNGYLKTLTTCKHFAGFSSGFNLGNNQDQGFNALISDQDMADTYLVPFRACVTEAKGASVMCSYNAINGVPSCGNAWLLTDVLRSELGFEGHVVSDCSGVQDVSNRRFPKNATCLAQQGTTAPTQMNQTTSDCWCDRGECAGFPTAGDMATAAAVFNAGTDLDCGTAYQRGLADAMTANRVAAVQIDAALERLFVGRMKLGEFDPPERQPYAQIPWTSINSPDHQALALQAAREAMTLLKNNQATTRGAWNTGLPDIADTTGRHVLPLSRAAVKTVAVIGPNANCTLNGSGGSCNQLGNYATFAPFVITPAAGIGQFAAVVGCEGSKISTRGPPRPADKQGFAQAAAQAGAADATVLVMGMLVSRDASQQPGAEGEGNDRAVGGVAIPQIQLDLVDHVATASAGKPLIVVVMSGAQLDLSPWSADPRISALLWVGYPGMMGGQAIAEVLFGIVSPAGRLPYTILTDASVRSMNAMQMDMRPSGDYPGRTYRFYNPSRPSTGTATMKDPAAVAPVYRFGFGLSYTTFTYAWVDEDPVSADGPAHNHGQGAQETGASGCGSDAHLRRRAAIRTYLKGFATTQSAALAAFPGIDVAHYRVNVTNSGSAASATSVLAFAVPPNPGVDGAPLEQLFGFHKIFLQPGQSQVVTFMSSARDFTLVAKSGVRWPPEGGWTVRIGGVGDGELLSRVVCM